MMDPDFKYIPRHAARGQTLVEGHKEQRRIKLKPPFDPAEHRKIFLQETRMHPNSLSFLPRRPSRPGKFSRLHSREVVYNLPMVRACFTSVCLCVLLLLPGAGLAFQSAFTDTNVSITPRARPAAAPEPQAVLRTDSSLVVIPTWVSTAAGASVTSLDKENFRISDDSVEQPISYFIKDDAPLSIGLLFDTSGSMRDKMDKASEAVAAFLKTANPEDEFFLVEFNDRAKLMLPFTQDSGAIYDRIVRTKPVGRTSLLDAIQLALTQMKKAKRTRKAIVIISDGGDNWSRHTAREIRNALLESDVQLYAMGIFDAEFTSKSPRENRNGPALLDELANLTGGRQYPVANLNDLPTISAKIGLDLRNEYLLGYYPADSRDGKYHHVTVKLTVPESTPPLRANYRRGYYAASE
jgi:Ca-activated chloride channel homolog